MHFLLDSLRAALMGSRRYYGLLAVLFLVAAVGVRAYLTQLQHGLVVTGMTDQVSWGAYIANFTYLVGLAAAAVMLVIPAYIFHRPHAKRLVMIAEGIAVAACSMALMFVLVDLGRPDRMLIMLSGLNLPRSLLAWDVIVIPGYFALNLVIPAYVLFHHYRGEVIHENAMFPWILLTIFWAIALHTVTAFIFAADIARPFWHSALLAPRFLASAFCSGPAFLILVLVALRKWARLEVPNDVIHMLSLIVTIALQVNLVMLVGDVFTELYATAEHHRSAVYLFLGLGEHGELVPWIRSAIAMQLLAVFTLMIRPLRRNAATLLPACALTVVGVWIEKGMGFVIPGFVPTPLGEIVEYAPSLIEIQICAGVWAIGLMIFLVFAKVAIAIEHGELHARG